MATNEEALSSLFKRLAQRPYAATLSVQLTLEGSTAFSILAVQPEAVMLGEAYAEILLPHGLGRLSLDAQHLSGYQQNGDTWQLDFGPLRITIHFKGNS
ncbi:hypothetical protein Q0M94_25225 (plasmid) [Deinococcus radiomollis]|uniref:hypothetical protein n=1 Tax=Deinococcus radiomollis TaxID=468916 RepID=UPI0038912D90